MGRILVFAAALAAAILIAVLAGVWPRRSAQPAPEAVPKAVQAPSPPAPRRPADKGRPIVFQGNRNIPTSYIQDTLRLEGKADEPAEVLNKVREIYLAFGFLRVTVQVGRDPADPSKMLVGIEEGRPYTWGDVKVESAAVPPESLDALFHVERGWPANMAEMRSMMNRHVEHFRGQGYLDCAITPTLSYNDEAGQVNLRLQISEGPRYVVYDVAMDAPELQALFGRLKGEYFLPAAYEAALAQAGLKRGDVRLEFDRPAGRVTIHKP